MFVPGHFDGIGDLQVSRVVSMLTMSSRCSHPFSGRVGQRRKGMTPTRACVAVDVRSAMCSSWRRVFSGVPTCC